MLEIAKKSKVIAISASWFFLILTSYYVLKPLRDALGTTYAKSLPELYLATFVSTIVCLAAYSKLVAIVGRMQFVFWVYQFFVACVLLFYTWFTFFPNTQDSPSHWWMIASFFVWVSVFNLYITTLFWSVMADLYSAEESQAWFGWIASGGSIGSLAGSGVALLCARWFDIHSMLLICAVLLELGLGLAYWLHRERSQRERTPIRDAASPSPTSAKTGIKEGSSPSEDQGTGGSIYAGLILVLRSRYLLTLCLFVLMGKFAATFLYNHLQLTMRTEVLEEAKRVDLFASMQLFSQLGSLFLQGMVAGWMMTYWGVRATLFFSAAVVMTYFGWLCYAHDLTSLMTGQVLQQCIGYGLLVPAQNALFSVVTREEKYKSKAFTDTVVFRGSDVLASQACKQMDLLGVAFAFLCGAMIPVLGLWCLTAYLLGTMYQRRFQQAKPTR